MTDRALTELARCYLPPAFAVRAPVGRDGWRTRTALLLWALGYPLEMAWSTAMDREPAASRRFQTSIGRLDDARLVDLLDATTESRGDGRELSFVELPGLAYRASALALDRAHELGQADG